MPGGGGGGGPSSTAGFLEDRVTVGSYGEIAAVAASTRMVFVASEAGLAVYDALSQRWLRPLTAEEGYPVGRITGLAADPETDGVWIAAVGEVLLYRPSIDQLIRTIIAGRVDRIMFDRDDPAAGAYVGYGDRWTRVSPTGFAFNVNFDQLPPRGQQIVGTTLESLYREMPALESFSGLLTRDDALRSWRPTSGARVDGRSEVWIGTLGGGLYLADPLFNRARHLPYGLFERGASSLAVASEGVWAGSAGLDFRGTGGVSFASSDLQQWQWLRGPADGSMAGLRIHDIVVRGDRIWVATDRGVASRSVEQAAAGQSPEWRWEMGRSPGRAFALAATLDGVWVSGDRDVALLAPADDRAQATREGSNASTIASAPARSMVVVGDTLWMGTDAGLALVRRSDATPRVTRPTLAAEPIWFQRPTVALARSDSVLAVATDSRVGLINLSRGAVALLPGDPDFSRLGRLLSVAIDARTLWVGGDRGAVVVDRSTGIQRVADQPGRLAEPVLDIALHAEFAWLATPSGLVRIRRLPDGGIR